MDKICREATCDLDYKAEYNRLREENAKLKEEIDFYRSMEQEAGRMKAQLDMVYMIFGRRLK